MVLTAAQAGEYRQILTEVNRMAQYDLVALWRHFSDRSRDEFFAALRDGVPEVVALYRAMAAETAGLFYEETQGVEFQPALQTRALVPNYEQLERNLRWAYYGVEAASTLSLVSGIVQKHVVDGSRDYAIEAMGPQTWMRQARPEACNFCRLLATRGVQNPDTGRMTSGFSSEDAAAVRGGSGRTRNAKPGRASRPIGEAFHENCMCIPVLQNEYEVPSYVEEWLGEYNQAYENVGDARDLSAILAEMRKINGHRH